MTTIKSARRPGPRQRNRLHRMAHELKTPLATVRDSAELLADGTLGPLTDVQREVVEILRRNSRELQRLIELLVAGRNRE